MGIDVDMYSVCLRSSTVVMSLSVGEGDWCETATKRDGGCARRARPGHLRPPRPRDTRDGRSCRDCHSDEPWPRHGPEPRPLELPAPPRDSRGVSQASNSRVAFSQSFTLGRNWAQTNPAARRTGRQPICAHLSQVREASCHLDGGHTCSTLAVLSVQARQRKPRCGERALRQRCAQPIPAGAR